MQYGRALERLIREVVIANPSLGPVHYLKADVSDGFYRIGLRPTDLPKLGIVFTFEGEDEELVAIPLTLSMGWKDFPPIFCTETDTVADLENAALHCNTPFLPHKLDYMTESIVREAPPTLQTALTGMTRDSYLRRANTKPAAYVDIFA